MSEQHLDEGRLSCTVVTHDAHFLISVEVIVEISDYHLVGLKGFRDILTLENLASDIYI